MLNTRKTGWHVLYVRSSQEKKVNQLLKDNNLETFLPTITTIRQWSDRKKTIIKPLFPSYIFVNINSSVEFYKTLSVDGACSYIRFGREYALATEKEINQIKFLVSQNEISDLEINTRVPKIGDKKIITIGALAGLECEVLKMGNVNKIVVQIYSLQQNITATIPLHYLEE